MTPKRLPLLALPVMIGQEFKSWWYLLIVAGSSIFKQGFNWWAVLGIAAALLFIIGLAAVRYWRFSYLIDDQAVTINSGLFVKKVRHIPYPNIQTLSHQQWFFLQPFGLETLNIETSSKDGKEGAGTLFAVSTSVGQEIEAHRHHQPVLTTEASETEPQEPTTPTFDAKYQISARDLNLYAATSMGFLAILAALGWLWNKLDDVIPKTWQENAFDQLAHLAVFVLVFFIILFLAVAVLISYLNLLQRYYHFTLTKQAHTLTATRGFFKRLEVSVRISRIQAVRMRQSLLRHWLHLTTIQALLASNAADEEKDNDLVLLPVIKADLALSMMHNFIDWVPTTTPEFTPVSKANHWYFVRNWALWNLGLVAIIALVVGHFWRQWLLWTLIVGVLWVLIQSFQGLSAARFTGVAIIDAHTLLIRNGSLWHQTQYVVRRQNIQAMSLKQSIWMTRKHVAHLVLSIRRGDGNEPVEARYLEAESVEKIMTWYRRH
ncbi:PH domain-containing protein [Lacticaseibacillus porcinae]|uniref:PH domain-containing protein n=1 Tax=Lacticaseibacillus porcinae TaxID=1123687 RepID=UPI0013DE4268|nr:PH domain-containing protein [Lacticaseibacillus porcinae]